MSEDSEDFIKWPCDNKKGYLKAYEGDACGFAYAPNMMQKSVLHGVSFALLTKRGGGSVRRREGGGTR